jgi:alanyl-tRNA synthetase
VSTERLYYHDCYVSSFEATVVRVTQTNCVYLDRTAFYPTSGGQPHDLGTLGGQLVLDVIDEGAAIAHQLAGPLAEQQVVSGLIDWSRRYDHMQQHTGQHLLSAVFAEQFGCPTVSFHMGSEVSTIELATDVLSDAQLEEAERHANAVAGQSRPVHISFEDAGSVEGLRKPSDRVGLLRIIEIEGLDRSACGGTHVHSTSETGPLQIRKTEKIRGNVRVEFVCGLRALAAAKQDFRVASELARQSASAVSALPEYFAGLRQRLTIAEKERHKLSLELARREGEHLYASAVPGDDGLRRIRLLCKTLDEGVRVKAQAFAAQPRTVALVLAEEPPGVLIACSSDAGLNAGAILKRTLAEAGGRGGGAATLAQGSLPDSAVADTLAAALGFS